MHRPRPSIYKLAGLTPLCAWHNDLAPSVADKVKEWNGEWGWVTLITWPHLLPDWKCSDRIGPYSGQAVRIIRSVPSTRNSQENRKQSQVTWHRDWKTIGLFSGSAVNLTQFISVWSTVVNVLFSFRSYCTFPHSFCISQFRFLRG